MKIVKKGNEYLIKTPNKTFTYKTLKGAQNKLSKLKAQQKVSQSQKQSVIVNVSTSKPRSSGAKSTPSVPRPTPTSAIFSILEQFGQARPRHHNLIPSKETQDELKKIKKTINELREENLKLVEAENRRVEEENLNDIFIRQDKVPSDIRYQPLLPDSETDSVDSGFGESEALEQLRKTMTERRGRKKGFDPIEEYYEKPNRINSDRDENITTEDALGKPIRPSGGGRRAFDVAPAARADTYDDSDEDETSRY